MKNVCDCSSHNGFLTAKGLEEAEQRRLELPEFQGVDERQLSLYLDSRISVSGARRDETLCIFDDEVIDEQYRRFLDGLSGEGAVSGAAGQGCV